MVVLVLRVVLIEWWGMEDMEVNAIKTTGVW